jgi:hypothetical protein
VALLGDRKSIYGALAKLGLLDPGSVALSSDPSPLFPQRKPSALAALSEHKPMVIAAATLVVVALLAGFALLKKPDAPTPGYKTASQKAEGATKVVGEFFDALNSGFSDSSLFDSELRLGRRGNMTKVEAVTTLRQFQSQYSKVKCRPGGDAPTLKTPELSRSDLRVKVDVDCDFADKKGKSTSTSFPIEIEAAPDPQNAKGYLITGMWHSDKMILWQPRARD